MGETNQLRGASVLVVDDDFHIRFVIMSILKERGFLAAAYENATDALAAVKEKPFDVVLTDIKMPVVSGLELLEAIHSSKPEMPVILMTAYAELETAVDAIRKGAFDFIIKPFAPEYLMHTLEKAVRYSSLVQMEKTYKTKLESTVRQRTQELADTLERMRNMNKELIGRLTAVAEYRDTDTGTHISRIGRYSAKIAEALGMTAVFVEDIMLTSSMHDIGKIGIPDSILLKPGALTPDEFELMKSHAAIGHNMLADASDLSIQMAASIALNHHERWDGTGYPRGLRGETTPIEGRIVMLADQYDALRSRRPYKQPLSHVEVFRIIVEGDGRTMPCHFDPSVLSAFIKVATVFDNIFATHSD